MHDTTADGNEYFKCDFCQRGWSDDRPMVEGHRGSLICKQCLSVAYTELVHLRRGEDLRGSACTMCLETRDQAQWSSPMFPESRACLRCVRQAAGVLSKDPEFKWQRPEPPAGARSTDEDAGEEA